jgi:hypothetical protein
MQYILTLDAATINRLRWRLDELQRLKEKWPDDYEMRPIYQSRANRVLVIVDDLFRNDLKTCLPGGMIQ